MIRPRRAAVLILALAAPAGAQDLSPEDFQARTEGRVFGTYFPDGSLQGHEIFLHDRKVIWQAAGSSCRNGIWHVQNGYVCYLYENTDPGYCLIYRAQGDTIVGDTDTGETFLLHEASRDDVTCPVDQPLLSRADTTVTHR